MENLWEQTQAGADESNIYKSKINITLTADTWGELTQTQPDAHLVRIS